MFFKGGRATVFGRRGTYAAFAVFVAGLAAVVAMVLLAAPARSQDGQNKKDGSDAGETQTQGSSAQGEKRESGDRSAGNTATRRSSTQEKGQSSGDKNKGSGKGPIAGARVKVEKDGGTPKVVDAGDVLVIGGSYKIRSDASVTIRDGNGTEGTFGKQNAEIKVGSVKIEVEEEPIGVSASEELTTEDLEVVETSGVTVSAKRDKKQGRRGGRAARNNCDVIIDQYIGTGLEQYNNVDIDELILNCRAGGGGGRGGRGGENVDIEFEEEIEVTETTTEIIEERSADSPDGAVADTSSIDTLPNTGGPSFFGGALVPALALLTAGVGFSVLRFGSGRSRRDDD